MSGFDVGFSLVIDVIGNLQNLEQNPHHYASWLARFGGKAVWTNSFLWPDGPLQIFSTIHSNVDESATTTLLPVYMCSKCTR